MLDALYYHKHYPLSEETHFKDTFKSQSLKFPSHNYILFFFSDSTVPLLSLIFKKFLLWPHYSFFLSVTPLFLLVIFSIMLCLPSFPISLALLRFPNMDLPSLLFCTYAQHVLCRLSLLGYWLDLWTPKGCSLVLSLLCNTFKIPPND